MHDKMAWLGEFFDARAGTPKPKKGTAADAKEAPKGHKKKWLTLDLESERIAKHGIPHLLKAVTVGVDTVLKVDKECF